MTQPEKSDTIPTPAEWRTILEARPLPGDASPPWSPDGGGYEGATESLAHAFLVLADERPELLKFGPDEDSWARADNQKLWEAAKARWPGLDDWLGGITWFQFGWAHNIVRYVVGVDAVGNPAIVEVEVPDE